MKKQYLEFERPIAELSNKISELKAVQNDSSLDIIHEISQLQSKLDELTKDIYS